MREWRQRRRLSQLDLALAADVSSRHVSFVETGRSAPSRAMVLRLADALDVPRREQNQLLLAAGLWLGLLGIAMATGLAIVLRTGQEIPETYWRSIFDYPSGKTTALQRV